MTDQPMVCGHVYRVSRRPGSLTEYICTKPEGHPVAEQHEARTLDREARVLMTWPDQSSARPH